MMWLFKGMLTLITALSVLEVQAEECRWSKSEKLILGREAGNQRKFRLIGALNGCGKSNASKGDKRTADDALKILGFDEVWLADKIEADAEWSRSQEEAAQQRAEKEQLRVEEEKKRREKAQEEAFAATQKLLARISELRASNQHFKAAELIMFLQEGEVNLAKSAAQATQVNTDLTNQLLELLIEQGDKQMRQNEQIIELLEGMQSP